MEDREHEMFHLLVGFAGFLHVYENIADVKIESTHYHSCPVRC